MSAEPDRGEPAPEVVARELRAALGTLYRRIRQTRVPGDLTLSESSALSRLRRAGPTSAAAVAKLEQISPQSMSATLASLEARGLIERSRDPGDGRRILLALSDAGQATVASRHTARAAQLTRALAALSAAERAQLCAVVPLLERLAREL